MINQCRSGVWMYAALILGLALATELLPGSETAYELRDGQWAPVAKPAEGTAEGELELIRSYLDQGNNRKVESAAENFLKKYSDDPGRQEVMKMAGQAQMNRQRYWQAYDWWRRLWEEAPGGEYSDLAMEKEFAVAVAFLEGKKRIVWGFLYLPARSEGQEILRRIVEQSPMSRMAETAQYRLAEDYLNHEEFVEAANTFDQFTVLFPKSPKVPQATLEAARATYLSYRGAAYDPTPLGEAQQRYRELLDRYPKLAEQARADDVLRDIHNQLAVSELSRADTYQRIGKRVQAAYYYRKVADRYHDTEAGEQAGAALAKLQTAGVALPAEPAPASRPSSRPVKESP